MADFERRSERGEEMLPSDLYRNTAGEIEARDAAARRNLTAEQRAEVRVVVLDSIGELGRFYSLADLVFVGGSLVSHGGHNILEPAAQGKPILVGPHMFNFRETYALFSKRNACVTVLDGQELAQKILELLQNKQAAEQMGSEAAQIVAENQGAAVRTVEHLRQIIEKRG